MKTVGKTITRERLEQLADNNTICKVSWDERIELAQIALAAMDSEPVAIVEPSDYVTAAQLVGEGPARKAVHELYEGALRIGDKLYRHAQPAPNNRAITQHFDTIALETAREILCDVNRRHEFLGGDVQLLSRIQCRIDAACRAAMLSGGKS
ncbi:TPA: hypothetical protein MCR80_005759 [Klebsiella pneumoniae]|nr:hypothetical protein [Klebsiella pneumoniae]